MTNDILDEKKYSAESFGISSNTVGQMLLSQSHGTEPTIPPVIDSMQKATSILGVASYGREKREEKGINRATITEGIDVHKEDGTPHDLSSVNRDPAKAKETFSKEKDVFSIAVPGIIPEKFADSMRAISATAQDLKENVKNFFQEAKNKVDDPVAERQIAALEQGLNQVTEILEESGIEADEQAAIIEHTLELFKEPEIAKNVGLTQVVNDVMGDKPLEEASLGQMLEVSQATTKHVELTNEGMAIVKDRENPAEVYRETLLGYGVDINDVNTIHAYANRIPEELANEIKHNLAKEVNGIVEKSREQANNLWQKLNEETYKETSVCDTTALDVVQEVFIDGIGCLPYPPVSIGADLFNAGIYYLREDWAGVGISLLGVQGVAGDIQKITARTARRALKEDLTLAKTAKVKGEIGEAAADIAYAKAGFEKWPSKLLSNHGIDGVYVKRGLQGEIEKIHIVESKMSSTGRASMRETKTKDKQMSDRWIKETIKEMRASKDPAVRETGEMMHNNRDKIVRKANVLDSEGVNRWDTGNLPESKEFK